MEFNNLNEVINFIENAVSSTMPQISKDIKEIMDDETNSQVKGWSDQIFNSVEPTSTDMTAEAEFKDNGKWYSLITGDEVGNPIKFLEAGSTWNRDASNIMESSFGKCNEEIPQKLKNYLLSMGIPIE